MINLFQPFKRHQGRRCAVLCEDRLNQLTIESEQVFQYVFERKDMLMKEEGMLISLIKDMLNHIMETVMCSPEICIEDELFCVIQLHAQILDIGEELENLIKYQRNILLQ